MAQEEKSPKAEKQKSGGVLQKVFGSLLPTDESKADKQIINKMKSKQDECREISILLLGVGGSGKTTVLKQMQRVYNEYDEDKQMESTIISIKKNILNDICDLCTYQPIYLQQFPDCQLKNEENNPIMKKIINNRDAIINGIINDEMCQDIKLLWQDDGIKKTYEIRCKYDIIDYLPYFINKLDLIILNNYKPNFDDYLRVRATTSGVICETFQCNIKNQLWLFNITDVGGQRSERRKWIKCFHDIDVVLYIMSLSSYDQVLYEDHNIKCYDDSLTCFETICHHKVFNETDFIIFLNKSDLFDEKIKIIPFNIYKSDWNHLDNFNGKKVILWLQNEFHRIFTSNIPKELDLKKANLRGLHYHITCATDNQQFDAIVQVVQLEVVRRLLVQSNMI